MRYDIAIVGAGPAGCLFARRVSDGRRKILLVDGQNERNRKPCGGLLAPDAQKILAQLDLTLPKDVLVSPQIFLVRVTDLVSGLERNYQRHYLNMDRYLFDRFLMSQVPQTVEVVEGRCTEVTEERGLFRLKIGGREYESECVVGADGASGIVRRSLIGRAIPHLTAVQQWFRAEDGINPFYSCVYDRKTSSSCSWILFKDGYLIYGGCFKTPGARDAFEKQKIRVENRTGRTFGNAEKTEACLVCNPKRLGDFRTGRTGVYLIGEAAGFISASSFEGFSSAFSSAMKLAEAFDEGYSLKGIARLYRRKTFGLKLKLFGKITKSRIIGNPILRYLIMKTGISSIKMKI